MSIGAWTLRTSPLDGENLIESISVWSESLGLFIIAGAGVLMTSPDGIAWTNHGNVFAPTFATGITGIMGADDSNPTFVVGVPDFLINGVYRSTDGTSWVHAPNPFDGEDKAGAATAYSPALGMWIAASITGTGSPNPIIMSSVDDGSTWTLQSTPWDATSGSLDNNGACWSPSLGLFVVTGDLPGKTILTSPDGVVWTNQAAVPSGWSTGGQTRSVYWSDALNMLVAVGYTDTNDHSIMVSSDGITWTNVPNDPLAPGTFNEADCAIDAGGVLYVGGQNNGSPTVFATADASAWLDTDCPLDERVLSLAYSPSLRMLVAFGSQVSGDEVIATALVEAPLTQYQRIYGWTLNISDDALETVDPMLTSPQGFTA